jgi:hypothetical protein
MSDCDSKERKALRIQFPGIILLLCLWHMGQAVGNRLRSELGTGGDAQVKARREQIRAELRSLTKKYVIHLFFSL